jgi:hypothetical protein
VLKKRTKVYSLTLDPQLDGVLGKLKGKYSELKVVAYLATWVRYRFDTSLSWVLSLCLETMQLEKLFQRPHECCYGMASFISW